MFKNCFAAVVVFLTPFAAAAQDLGGGLLQESGTKGGYKETGTIESTVGTIIKTVISLLGVIFLILLIYGGYLWLIARGNEELVDKAKDTIRSAIIGLIICLAAYAITYFLVANLTKGTIKL